MKKKITAIVLALCLVLGLLPMSALAAVYEVTFGSQNYTVTVDDKTNDVTATNPALDHYSFAPAELPVFNVLYHYDGAPDGIVIDTVTGTLQDAFTAITVSFEAGESASGSMTDATVSTKAEADTWTLPECGFTAPEGKIFAGWTVKGGDGTVYPAGSAYALTENVTFVATWEVPDITVDENGALQVGENASLSEGETIDIDAGTTETITVPQETLTALTEARVEAIAVENQHGTVTVPVSLLIANIRLTVQAGTTVSASASIKVELTGAPDAETASRGTALKDVLQITVKVPQMPVNPIFAYKDGDGFRRIRGVKDGSSVTFKTRHLTEFVVLDGDAVNTDKIPFEYLPVLAGATDAAKGSVGFLTEAGDYYCIAYKTAGGKVGAIARNSGDRVDPNYGMAYVAESLEGIEIQGVTTSETGVTLGGQFGLQFNTVAASRAFTSDQGEPID